MGKKLLVYLMDGTEYGPRIVEIGNWSGKAIYSNRASLSRIMKRPEMDGPGVYFLKSPATKSSYTERIYIGQGEIIGARLNQHLSDPTKDFEDIVFFVSKDAFLTKAHILYLESRLIELAKAAKGAEVENKQSPNLPLLHEADISDMDYFLDQIKLILPLMGFRFLIETVIKEESKPLASDSSAVLYSIKSKVIKATMYEDKHGFIVTKGSFANMKMAPAVNETYKQLREKLIETGILIPGGQFLIFAENTVFSSVSAAANVVLGRQTPGPLMWISPDNKTFKEISEQSFY